MVAGLKEDFAAWTHALMEKSTTTTQRELGASIQQAAAVAFDPTLAEAASSSSGHGKQGLAAARPTKRTFRFGKNASNDDMDTTGVTFTYI